MKPSAVRLGPPARKTGRAGPPREVRLIGGQWKRSKLPVVNADGLRPTPDRVRETLFNWLGHDLSGWRCLDAFAGSGALGFEAASRFAASVVLLERDRRVAAGLEAVRLRLKAEATVRVECVDALAWMARAGAASFELVFVDPPFASELAAPALDAATRLVVPSGFVYLESGSALAEGDAAARGLRLHRHGRAGAVHFHLLQQASDG